MLLKCFLSICVIFVAIYTTYFPGRHAVHYNYIEDELISSELLIEKRTNIEPNLKPCNYYDLIVNNYEVDINDIYNEKDIHAPQPGGWFRPTECDPLVKAAIIVPYRNRTKQLKIFLNYMHYFLQKQHIEYRIIIVHQNDSLPFNRAKMINYGAKTAMNLKYDCLILHDIDLIPLNLGNIYGCVKNPRHMSSSLDTFRYNLPYLTLFGGAISISSEHFMKVNGFSNMFYGWGGEDDDFYKRLKLNDISSCRFSPKLSKYIMLNHKKEKPTKDRYERLKSSEERFKSDGVSQLSSNYDIVNKNLYTAIYAA